MPTVVDAKDLPAFAKLGIRNAIELALLLPSHYEDRNLYTTPSIGNPQLIDAEIKSFVHTGKSIKMTLFAYNLEQTIDAVIFQPKSYHRHQFGAGQRLFLFGKLELNFSQLQLVQPRIVKDAGGIAASYKSVLRADVMSALLLKYLTRQRLMQEGLSEELAQALCALHFPAQMPPKMESEAFLPSLYALKFAELYNHLQLLSGKKESYPALRSFMCEYEPWTQTLPFELTQDQLRTIKKIQKDLSGAIAAKRMVVGDVGAGKTMVILACAYMAREQGAVLMAPTTVLANQLFEEAQKFLPASMKIALVTNRSKKESLADYDFIIGTHALLFRELNDAAVVMIDEQHRFGTAQRNRLSKLMERSEKRPHFFQFSATPIPRTQAMIDSALIDVSLITQTPFEKDIDTSLIRKSDFARLLEHIKSEIALEHQILIVYPLVEKSEAILYQSIEEARNFWESRFENVYVTHGKDKQKEQVLYDFREKGSVLLATTVVEVGISLPRLSTVVIVGAERLGLSSLHQLRGRVSRTGLKGYCYLYTNLQESKRLSAFSKTMSGFEIAKLDLRYRKSGDLLSGAEQSGVSFRYVDMADDEEIISQVQKYIKAQSVQCP